MKSSSNTSLGKKLKELRKASNYTQDYVATVLGVVRQTYSHYETGKRTPDSEALYKLSGLYNISLEDLLHLSINLDPQEFYDAPISSPESIELDAYLQFINNSVGTKQIKELSDVEKHLLFYFHNLSLDDQTELIEIAKLKLRKKH